MKIKTCKQSGQPVDLKDAEAWEKEFKERYDEILEEMGNDMREVHTALEMLDHEMADKYDTIKEFDYPKSAKKFRELVHEHGSILVSTHKDTGELMFVVMDMGI